MQLKLRIFVQLHVGGGSVALLRLLVLVAGASSKQVIPEQTPTVGLLTTVSLQFESLLQEGLGLTQWTWKRRRMALEATTALVLSVVWWWWRLGTAEITGRSAPFPLSSLLKSLAHPLVLYFFSFVRSTKLATRFPTRHHTLKMASAWGGCHKTVFFDHPTPRFAQRERP